MNIIVKIVDDPIDEDLIEDMGTRDDGAVVIFKGRVRASTDQRSVDALEYEAFPEMAVAEMRRIAESALDRWPLHGVCLVHRIGRLLAGETSVLVAVSSSHRTEAFEAAKFCIDSIKEGVTIWKKEIFEDGSEEWVGHA